MRLQQKRSGNCSRRSKEKRYVNKLKSEEYKKDTACQLLHKINDQTKNENAIDNIGNETSNSAKNTKLLDSINNVDQMLKSSINDLTMLKKNLIKHLNNTAFCFRELKSLTNELNRTEK